MGGFVLFDGVTVAGSYDNGDFTFNVHLEFAGDHTIEVFGGDNSGDAATTWSYTVGGTTTTMSTDSFEALCPTADFLIRYESVKVNPTSRYVFTPEYFRN
jgi:hypothetical protein